MLFTATANPRASSGNILSKRGRHASSWAAPLLLARRAKQPVRRRTMGRRRRSAQNRVGDNSRANACIKELHLALTGKPARRDSRIACCPLAKSLRRAGFLGDGEEPATRPQLRFRSNTVNDCQDKRKIGIQPILLAFRVSPTVVCRIHTSVCHACQRGEDSVRPLRARIGTS